MSDFWGIAQNRVKTAKNGLIPELSTLIHNLSTISTGIYPELCKSYPPPPTPIFVENLLMHRVIHNIHNVFPRRVNFGQGIFSRKNFVHFS